MRIEGAVVDVDGTVLRSETVIEGAREGLAALRDAGVRVVFVSNNPTLTSDDLARRLRDAGIDAEHAVTSASLTARYVADEYPDAAVRVVGEDAVVEALRSEDIEVVTHDGDVVVVSIDRDLTYDDIHDAAREVRDAMGYVCTDPDAVIPTGDGNIPGTGAIEAAVSRAAGREPVVVGKPSEVAAKKALGTVKAAPDETVFVGDRLDTDIALGESVGAKTAVVLTGVTSRDGIGGGGHQPDRVLDSLAEVGDLL